MSVKFIEALLKKYDQKCLEIEKLLQTTKDEIEIEKIKKDAKLVL
jgi:hypothetical protein